MRPGELEALLNAHAFLRVERPPALWEPDVSLEPFVRLLGEMIAAALVRNGGSLAEVTLNVSNVTVEEGTGGAIPTGDFVSITIRSGGDWGPESTWQPGSGADPPLVGLDLQAAASAAGAAYGYSRVLGRDEGSVTVFLLRLPPASPAREQHRT